MAVGRRRARESGYPEGGMGRRFPRVPRMDSCSPFPRGQASQEWRLGCRRARGSGYPEGGMGRGLPRVPGMDSCLRRNGCYKGVAAHALTTPAPHDHPCESRGPLPSGPFDKRRGGSRTAPTNADGGNANRRSRVTPLRPFVVSLSNHASGHRGGMERLPATLVRANAPSYQKAHEQCGELRIPHA